jgi:phosphate-selective porin OprO/OprP
MRPNPTLLALSLAALPAFASAADFDNWPTKYTFGDGTELAATANIAYDYNDFSSASGLEDDDAVRRKEFGATLKKKGVYDAMVYYDFQADTWLDVFVRFESKAFFGRDVGRFRFGYMKTPVGLDANTSSRAGSFRCPVQAFYEGRRTGVEWVLERPQYLLQAGAYGGKDLQGDNPGTTQAVRAVWTPVKAPGDVIHLGLAYSQENPRGYSDGRDVHHEASARLRAPGSRPDRHPLRRFRRWSPPTRSAAPAWKASGSAARSRCRPKRCAPRSPVMTASPTTPAAASTRWPAGC